MNESSTGPRAALCALADRLPETPLSLVTGPAGSGKSTILRAWRRVLEARSVPAPFLDLARWHADAASLCADLVDAIGAALPGFGGDTRQIVARVPDTGRDWSLLLRALLREWSASDRHAVLMLDGWHALDPTSPGGELVDELVAQAPPSLRFVVATRGAAPRAAARLRIAERLLEVTADDLSLRTDEVLGLLVARGLEPDPEIAALLVAQTEGWATGVVLAARLLTRVEPSERRALVSGLSRQHDLFRYFADEVLRGEPPERIAVLECAAVLGPTTAATLARTACFSGAPAHVAAAIERGLLHSDGTKVDLPPLWRTLLRERLGARVEPDVVGMRRRAAAAIVDEGRVEEALDLLGNAQDWDELGRTIGAHARTLAINGRRQNVLDWLERIPPARVAADPDLLLIHGGALLGRDPTRAQRLLEEAQRASGARDAWKRRTEATGMLVLLHLLEGRMDEGRAAVRSMLRLREIATNPAMRGALVLALAGAAFLAQRFDRVLSLCERAARYPLDAPNRWLAALGRVFVHILRGEWERARGVAEEAMADGEIARTALFHETLRLQRAVALVRAGDIDPGVREAELALEVLATLRADRTRLFAELLATDVWISAGDDAKAAERLASVAERLERLGHVPLEASCRSALALVLHATGDSERARHEAERADALHLHATASRPRLFAWTWLRPLWVLAATGDAARAEARAREQGSRLVPRGLPLIEHDALVLRAEIARHAGRAADADRFARDAWRVAAAARLPAEHAPLTGVVGLWTLGRALALGVDAHYLVERVRAERPRELDGLLRAIAADPGPRARERAVIEMGRIGDRAFHAALAAAERDPDTRVREAAKRSRERLDPAPRYALRIETLGGLRALRGDQEIPERDWHGQTTRRLLLRLLVDEGRPVSRETLVEDLWPDADPDDARRSLRVAVSRLNDTLEPDRPEGFVPQFVTATGDAIALGGGAGSVSWDVNAWLAAAQEALRDGAPEARGALRDAFSGWDGRFAPGIRDESWLVPFRRRCEELWALVGRRYADLLVRGGQLEEADVALERLLVRDDVDELAWAARAHLALRRGDRAAAARHLETARARLEAVLGVTPGPELRAVAAELASR